MGLLKIIPTIVIKYIIKVLDCDDKIDWSKASLIFSQVLWATKFW